MENVKRQVRIKNKPEFVYKLGRLAENFDCHSVDSKLLNRLSKKEVFVRIGKGKKGAPLSNFYAFDRVNTKELNRKLSIISDVESQMKNDGHLIDGLKSYNRNLWLDFSRESNAIEGVMTDFPIDLLDFRVELREKIACDPKPINKNHKEIFDKYEYYKYLLNRIKEIQDNNEVITIQGNNFSHKLSMSMIRQYIAFKYAYKSAKMDRLLHRMSDKERNKILGVEEVAKNLPKQEKKKKEEELYRQDIERRKNEFIDLIMYVNSLISGNTTTGFRRTPIYVKGANWVPPDENVVFEQMNNLAEFIVDDRKSGNLSPIERAAIFHAEFIRIHPFMDGNGRTGRIISNAILIESEMPTVSIRYKNTEKYFDAINTAVEEHDATKICTLFEKGVEQSTNKIIECMQYLRKKHKNEGKTL